MRCFCLLLSLVLTLLSAPAWTDTVQAAPLSRKIQRDFNRYGSRFDIDSGLIEAVLNDNPDAMIRAARDFLIPKSVPENRGRGRYNKRGLTFAVILLERASELGRPEAAIILLDLFKDSIGARLNSTRAYAQMLQLGRTGTADELVLAAGYLERIDRYEEAADYLLRALKDGEIAGLEKLAKAYTVGSGVPKNLANAYACEITLSMYALTHDERARALARSKNLALLMSPEDITASQSFQHQIRVWLFDRQNVRPSAVNALCAAGDGATLSYVLRNGMQAVRTSEGVSSPLLIAAANGRGEFVRFFVQQGLSPACADKDGCTPLMWMVRYADTATTLALLQGGADITARDKAGRTALHWAVSFADKALTELLLARGSDINAATKDGTTALMLASFQGNTEMISLLLAKGADAAAADSQQRTALALAAGHPEASSLLLSAGLSETDKTCPKGTWGAGAGAAHAGNSALLEALLARDISRKINVSKMPRTGSLLQAALINQRDETVSMLLASTPAFEDRRSPAARDIASNLYWTVTWKRHHDLHTMLADQRYVDHMHTLQAGLFFYAIALNNIQALDILLDHGADINARDRALKDTILLRAVEMNKPETVRLLLARGADVHARDILGNTPLLMAFLSIDYRLGKDELANKENIIRLLLEAGADTDVTNKLGLSVMGEAALHPELIHLLPNNNS